MNFICTIIPYIYKTYITRERYISKPNSKCNHNHNTITNIDVDTDVDIDTDIYNENENENQTKIDVIVDEHQQKHTHIHSDNQTHKRSDNDIDIFAFSLAESSYKFDYTNTTIKQEQTAIPIHKESQTVSNHHPTSNPNCSDTKSDIDDKEYRHDLSSDIKSSTLNYLDIPDAFDTINNEDSPDIEEITFKIYQIHCNIKTNDYLQPTLTKFISKVKEDNPLISTADNETENKATKNTINKTNTINITNKTDKTNKTNKNISGNIYNESESPNPVDPLRRSGYINHETIKETNTQTPIQTPIQTESKSVPFTDTANKPKSAQEINATKTDTSDPTDPTIFNFNFINELLGFDIYTETLKANLKKYIKHNIKLYDLFSANQSRNSNHKDVNKIRNSLTNKLKYDTFTKIVDIYFICIFKDTENTYIRYNKNNDNDDSKELNDTTSYIASPLNAAVTSTEQNQKLYQNHNQEHQHEVFNKDKDINNSNRDFYTILINKALELTVIYYYTLYISADLAASDFLILNTKYTKFTKSTEDNKHKHHRYRNYNVDGARFCDKGLNNIQHIEKSPNNPNNPTNSNYPNNPNNSNNYYKSQITGIFSRYNLENKIKIADTYNSITELVVEDGVEIDGDIKPDKQKQMQSPNYLDYLDYLDYSDCNSTEVTDATDVTNVIGNLKLFLEILYLNYGNSNSFIKSEQNSNNNNNNKNNFIGNQNISSLTLASIFNFLSDISFYNKEIKNNSQPSKSSKSSKSFKFLKTSDIPIANPIVSSSSVPNKYKYNHKKNDNQNHPTNTSTYTYNTSNIFNTHDTTPYNIYNEHTKPFICERRLMELFFNILIFMGIDTNTNINIINKEYNYHNYYNYYNYRDIVDKFLGDDRFKKLSDNYNPNLIKITTQI